MLKQVGHKKNVGIVGISGYTGGVLLEKLLRHPSVQVTYVSANNTQGSVSKIWPRLVGRTSLVCESYHSDRAIESCQLIFLAVPHRVSMNLVPTLLQSGLKVIDLSGDYRLNHKSVYKKYYGLAHQDTQNLKKAVYGIPEVAYEEIKKANLVSNPGCYPTAVILGLAPLVVMASKHIRSITVDAKSGVTGAGRSLKRDSLFSEVNEDFKAYKIFDHQHVPEMEMSLSKLGQKKLELIFVPHLLPLNRGLFSTIYVHLNQEMKKSDLETLYKRFYKNEPFVHILPHSPSIKDVCGTNHCHIGLTLHKSRKLIVITSAIDNLLKGASGQAIQNMNIMCGYPKEQGLM